VECRLIGDHTGEEDSAIGFPDKAKTGEPFGPIGSQVFLKPDAVDGGAVEIHVPVHGYPSSRQNLGDREKAEHTS
jgi:hypothetical protein